MTRWACAAALVVAVPAGAQTLPFADTEDATLSEVDVPDAARRWHPVVSFDVRNGDYARGALDDDDAALDRVPVHVAVGGVLVLRRDRLFAIAQSSNGFHAPSRGERTRPRSWYESNNLLGVAWRPVAGLTAAATYTIKTSPNGVAPTTHEASLTALYDGEDAVGRWKPRLAVTRRTRGDGGLFTILGVAPSFDLSGREDGPTLGVPLSLGIGWGGFYDAGSWNRVYGSGGITVSQPLRLGGGSATVRAELLALVRDDRLRRLDAPGGSTARVIPYATVAVAVAW